LETWEFDFEWLKVRHYVKKCLALDNLPDLQAILFMIGLQEYGNWIVKRAFTKEEKQDLMHVAVCALLESDGYYRFEGRDQDGWPHYKNLIPFKLKGVKTQENLIKTKIIEYFDLHEKETELYIKRNI
jgi:hypothetical protein